MITIIGHRGAPTLALENTLASFQKAIEIGVTAYEFDVHCTKDGYFVVCHDDHLSRVSTSKNHIKDTTYAELQAILLHDGSPVPLLTQVLDLARKHSIAVIVEVKISHRIEELCVLLDDYSDVDMTVASFKHNVIIDIRRLRPQYKVYLAETYRPIEVLQKARSLGAHGVDLNYMLLNPLTYLLARRWKLEIMVYTINHTFIAKILARLYPDIAICTNHPGELNAALNNSSTTGKIE